MARSFCLYFIFAAALLVLSSPSPACSQAYGTPKQKSFRVLAVAENGGHHLLYSKRARIWLDSLAATNNFAVDYLQNTDTLTTALLDHYQLFIQLDYPPYGWKKEAAEAFQHYITKGKGGWIGFHHATLLGEFDGYPMWQWFSDFMGAIRYENYIATFVAADVKIEDGKHPVMNGVPSSFRVQKEEWYIYDKSPRPNSHVLATVDESSYQPSSMIMMGDHPVVWTNEKIAARNVYIFMGHSPDLFDNAAYKRMFSNAIFWAAGTPADRTKH